MTFDKSKYKEVSELVKSIELKDQKFNLFGMEYELIIGLPEKYGYKEPAVYHFTDKERCGIFLEKNLDEKIQRPMLFHEIVEVYHRTLKMKGTPAHNAALPWEEKFCEEYLTKSELEEYLSFKKEHGCNGFELLD